MISVVHAQFPQVTNEERAKIYEKLKNENWTKIHTIGLDVSTIWYASYNSMDVNVVTNSSVNEFRNAAKPFTVPKLVVHVGGGIPTVH